MASKPRRPLKESCAPIGRFSCPSYLHKRSLRNPVLVSHLKPGIAFPKTGFDFNGDVPISEVFRGVDFSADIVLIAPVQKRTKRVAVISAKNHKRQRRKRQSVTAKREK